MNVWLLLAVFTAPILVGAFMGVWSWWWPRHQLDVIFAERRRERVAVERLPVPPEPVLRVVS